MLAELTLEMLLRNLYPSVFDILALIDRPGGDDLFV